MAKDFAKRYTLRTTPYLLRKFAYVAEYEGRSINKYIERLMRLEIEKFEKDHGEIELSDPPESSPSDHS